MPTADNIDSLGADVIRRWKEELFSADTVVAVVAVVVALPAGLVAAAVVGATAVYPVWFATAAGPSLGYWNGRRIEVGRRPAAAIGAAMALATAVATVAAFALALALGGTDGAAVVAGGLVGLLFSGLASRVAFRRLADATA
ncbi:MAG: hypothetical protein ABEJ26_05285 [Halosimplex sp.]